MAPLRDSHILPEFLYALVYDDHHRYLIMSTDPTARTISRPKGIYEKLFCEACEVRFSAWEAYGREVLDGGAGLQFQLEDGGFAVQGIDSARFKLFAMSLLWRAGRSRRPEFGAVELGRHEEVLRSMLDRGDPGCASDYGFSIVFPPDPDLQETLTNVIAPPQARRYQSHPVYWFLLGVTVWLFPVSDKMHELDAGLFSLPEGGRLLVRNGGQRILDDLAHFFTELADAARSRGGI